MHKHNQRWIHRSTLITAMSLALAILATPASAAEVKIYGRTDAGFLVQHLKGGDTTYELKSGGRSTPRIGINAVEKLPNGWEAKVYLENGFKMDTGEFGTKETLFDRRSIVALKGPWGELGMGRAGTVQSTMAPYSMGSIKWDPFGTSYGFTSVGSTFANTSRTDNGLYYHSPSFSGVRFGLSYSLGDKGDDAVEWDEKAHTLAMAVNYSTKDVWVGLTYANVKAKDAGALTMPDANLVQLGGWWRFVPEWRLFAGFGYQDKFASAGKMTRKVSLAAGKRNETFTGSSYLLGADWVHGTGKVLMSVQHFRGKADNLADVKLNRTVGSVAYEYSLRKNVILYTALNRSIVGGDSTQSDNSLDGTQFYAGLNFNF